MKKIRRSPVVTGLLFLMAVVLLFAGSVGGTQAALQVFSDNYYSALELDHIGVTLLENGQDTSYRNFGSAAAPDASEKQDGELVLNHLGDDPYFKIGKKYDFKITAINSGSIDSYLRVVVYKYWADVGKEEAIYDKGWFHGLSDHTTKLRDNDLYNPATIHLGYGGKEGYNSSAWVLDNSSRTDERDYYYYKGMVAPGGETEPLFDTLWIDPSVAKNATIITERNEQTGVTTTTYTYDYDGLGFVVQLFGDAIQTHNARAAIRSGWGMQDDNILSQMKVPAE
ncbi:MAG: hypothetical protein IKS55_04655 [Oscillospiraceae bacterium]|nr:hypothetical protein [Oscillospiraceae bacterium]